MLGFERWFGSFYINGTVTNKKERERSASGARVREGPALSGARQPGLGLSLAGRPLAPPTVLHTSTLDFSSSTLHVTFTLHSYISDDYEKSSVRSPVQPFYSPVKHNEWRAAHS